MKYVIYYRVSTQKQGRSGLGLEAQQRDVELFINNYASDAVVLGTFTDIESGAKNDREQYQRAIKIAKREGASILVSKLDRLGRRASELTRLMDATDIKVASMPNADKFQLQIYAALAEQERDFISQRTTGALKAAKARGTKLGRPTTATELKDMQRKGNLAVTAIADAFAREWAPAILPMRNENHSYSSIANWLNARGISTQRGKEWTAMGVCNLVKRMEKLN
ncbi:recombinase family protein [Vibrio alginolyticus]|uniref:recombinase family protein n=1 Tax=Vibrio alginolyticus TaxID=663 RepID=UPI00215BC572|nr:recombinase family protein [Vibrio alginolyticus]MCR9586581.1 recombinase family protein [Vibrio alginolyticus]